MARGVNKVILVGTCGQDPEVRYLPNGNAVTNLSLATSEAWTDKQTGQKVEKTEWHRVVLFGKVAEIAGEYLRKGSQCYIEGKLKTREWEKDGIKRYATEVHVDINGTLQLLGGGLTTRAAASSNSNNASLSSNDSNTVSSRSVSSTNSSARHRSNRTSKQGMGRTPKASTTISRSPRSTTWRAHDCHHVSACARREVRSGHGQIHWSALGRIPRKQASTGGYAIWLNEENAH